MTSDLAMLAADPTSIEVYDDPAKQIVLACERANAWLKAGIDVRIETIVETKAQAAALAEFAIQKQLGKDAELAALEVQRRAERGVGLAIRAGQERGEIASRGEHVFQGNQHGRREVRPDEKNSSRSPSDFFVGGKDQSETYALADTDEDAFEDAIEDAKAEGNLSRANVVRKVKGQPNGKLTGEKRLDFIRDAYGTYGFEASVIDGIGYLCDRYNGDLEDQLAVAKLANLHAGVNGLLNKAENIRRSTGQPLGQSVAAAAVEVINAGLGPRAKQRLSSWFREDAA